MQSHLESKLFGCQSEFQMNEIEMRKMKCEAYQKMGTCLLKLEGEVFLTLPEIQNPLRGQKG